MEVDLEQLLPESESPKPTIRPSSTLYSSLGALEIYWVLSAKHHPNYFVVKHKPSDKSIKTTWLYDQTTALSLYPILCKLTPSLTQSYWLAFELGLFNCYSWTNRPS